MRSQREWAAVVGILLLAAALRFTGLAFGQPDPAYAPQDVALNTIHENTPLHPDEFLFVQRPLRMLLTGQLNPKFFHNPSFLINTNLVVFWLTGERDALSWDGRDTIGARRAVPFRLYITGRTFSALGGMLAVAGAYATARLLGSHFAGLVTMGIVAVSVPMVQHAHYSTTSSLAAGFVAVCLWASLVSVRRFRPWIFMLAGVAAGLAAGSRYNAAAVSLVVFFAGWMLLYRERSWRRFGWVLAGWLLFPVTFVFTTPHVIADTAFVWSEFRSITNQYIGDEVNVLNVSPWTGLRYELWYLAVYGLGLPGTLAVFAGLWSSRRSRRVAVGVGLLMAYVLPYMYVVLRTIRPLGADQMLVPLIPAVAVVVGLGASTWRSRIKELVVWGGMMVLPLLASLSVIWGLVTVDTRYVAQKWAWDNLPAGARIWLHGPYNVPFDETRYEVIGQIYGGEVAPDADTLREMGVEYLVISDAWLQHFRRAQFIDPEDAAAVFDVVAAYDNSFTVIHVVPRPTRIGGGHPMHTATYWHDPEITLYCVTEPACEAVEASPND